MPRKCTECGKTFESEIRHCPEDGAPTITTEDENSLIGKVIDGRFSINGLLGVGGMGAVYRAHQFSTDRDVALKLLRRNLVEDEGMIRRFLREARAASSLANPHAVTVFDFGQTSDGILYIVMELVNGRTLADYLQENPGPMELRRAVRIITQVLDALVEAHNAGIIHRDLKPGNIMVLENDLHEDFVKVGDFGLAKMVEGDAQGMSQSGLVLGTPEYMSPEQAQGYDLDSRSDLYSLGVVLFELLAGVLPVEDDYPMATMMKKVREAPPALSEAAPQARTPVPVEELVGSLLARNPADRPATAREVREALIAGMDAPPADPRTPPTRAVPPASGEPAQPVSEEDEAISTGPMPVAAGQGSFRPRLAIGVFVAAGVAIGVAWLVSEGPRKWNGEQPVTLSENGDAMVIEPDPIEPQNTSVDVPAVTATIDGVDNSDLAGVIETAAGSDTGPAVMKKTRPAGKKSGKKKGVLRLLKRRQGLEVGSGELPLRRRED